MSFNDCKISESQIQTTGVQSQPDTLTGSAADNKMVFDALPTLVIQKLNSLIDQMQQQAAAGQIGVTPFDGMTAQTLQDALEQIQADIGGNYSGADGAGKVGYTPSEGVDEDTVQAAIEAVQANLTEYIAKIKAATGAAEVGNAPIAGMTATNVQQALEELRENIDNIVSGIIPGGSITSDMIQDGAVTADKLGSDVTGEEIPTSASDPTSISSQLSNKQDLIWHGIAETDADLNDLKQIGTISVHGTCTNMPPDTLSSSWGLLTVSANTEDGGIACTQRLSIMVVESWEPILYERNWNGINWSKWARIATVTKPQEFVLPLAEGFSKHYCAKYCKTQDGMVTVTLWIVGSGAANVETTIATLPEGFRPTELFRAEGIFDNGTIPSQNQCGITVNEYGQIAVQAKSAWGYVSAVFTFRAAG